MRRSWLSVLLVVSGCVGNNEVDRGPLDAVPDQADSDATPRPVDDSARDTSGGDTQVVDANDAESGIIDAADAGDTGRPEIGDVGSPDSGNADVVSNDVVVVDAPDSTVVPDADSFVPPDTVVVDVAETAVDSSPPDVRPDTGSTPGVPPTVLSITPAPGAVLTEGDRITITFSEPINTALMPAAFDPNPVGTSAATFTWSADLKTVTVDPKLMYPTGANPGAGSFSFTIRDLLRDIDGDALVSPESRAYRLRYRRFTRVLPYDGALSGNVMQGTVSRYTFLQVGVSTTARVDGYASFDMSGLPAGITSFERATLATVVDALSADDAPSKVGTIGVTDVEFATWSASALTALAGTAVGALVAQSTPIIVGTAYETNVTARLRDDYLNRVARGERTQFRLRCDGPINGESSRITFLRASTNIRVSWLVE